MFEVIPAIDVADGRLALYTPGGPVPVDAYGGDPLSAARAYLAAGARRVHVVDMDLAFEGEARNLDVVQAIATLGLDVQASGGVRNARDVASLLEAGARRVVLASSALGERSAVLDAIDRFAGRLLIGIEVDAGRIGARGPVPVDLPLVETLGWLVAGGAPAFLVTAVSKVATLRGPDSATVRRVVRAGRPVIAAGGVSSMADLRALRDAGAAGAVVGRAALEGGLDLARALASG